MLVWAAVENCQSYVQTLIPYLSKLYNVSIVSRNVSFNFPLIYLITLTKKKKHYASHHGGSYDVFLIIPLETMGKDVHVSLSYRFTLNLEIRKKLKGIFCTRWEEIKFSVSTKRLILLKTCSSKKSFKVKS